MLKTQVKRNIRKPQVNFVCTEEEKKAIEANAKKYANGEISEWVRYASIHFKPSKSDLAPEAKTKPRKR